MSYTNPPSWWIVLRTGGPRTLRLADSLRRAGVDAWTPRRTFRRPVPGAKPNASGQRPTQDLEGPILPTFVFARAAQVRTLEALEQEQANPHVASAHPPFSILRHRGDVPFVRDRDVEGLREEERREGALRQAMLDADTAAEARQLRIAMLKTEAARRRATTKLEQERRLQLAGERRAIGPGTDVAIAEMPAMAGMTGVVESNDGSTAWVRFGAQSWKIDAWRLTPRADIAA